MSTHSSKVCHTLEQLFEAVSVCANGEVLELSDKNKKYWTKIWKKHIEKHGNVPYIQQCAVCSGQEEKFMIKTGRWKDKRKIKQDLEYSEKIEEALEKD